VLDQACRALVDAGCTLAVGPIDGTTWRQYRLIVEAGTEPQFFLEPYMPVAWTTQWRDAGFIEIERYTSSLVTDLRSTDPRVEDAGVRLRGAGIDIRPLDRTDVDGELVRIFELSLTSFRASPFHTPIGWAEFRTQYDQILAHVEPGLVLIAESRDTLQGFLFAVPDVCQARRGAAIDTVVIKTLAVRPGGIARGLGSVLVAEAHARAAALGYRRAIHALMYERNTSMNISRRYGSRMRRYAVFARPLSALAAGAV